jgi:hypothetical protein
MEKNVALFEERSPSIHLVTKNILTMMDTPVTQEKDPPTRKLPQLFHQTESSLDLTEMHNKEEISVGRGGGNPHKLPFIYPLDPQLWTRHKYKGRTYGGMGIPHLGS